MLDAVHAGPESIADPVDTVCMGSDVLVCTLSGRDDSRELIDGELRMCRVLADPYGADTAARHHLEEVRAGSKLAPRSPQALRHPVHLDARTSPVSTCHRDGLTGAYQARSGQEAFRDGLAHR